MMKRFDVTIVGSICREIRNGDTDPVKGLGGSGMSAAIVASRLGANVSLAGFVGDEDSEAALSILESVGVDVGSIVRVDGASGTFMFPTERMGAPPWPMYRPSEHIPTTPPPVPLADVVLVFGFPELDPITDGWLRTDNQDAVVIWDRQGWLSKTRDSRGMASVPASRRIYVANLGEALDELSLPDEEALRATLPPSGFQAAVLKNGAAGCTTFSRMGDVVLVDAIEAFNVIPVSTIGSGDAFAGGLASALTRGETLEGAAIFGSGAAAAVIEAGTPLVSGLPERVAALIHGLAH
jgi:ribokinase